jgi:hypothetical protein
VLLTAAPAAAAVDTYEVQNTSGDATVANSLPWAVAQAESDPDPTTITFQAAVTGTITLLADLPTITADLAITGPGSGAVTVKGFSAGSPVFSIAGPSVSLGGMTLVSPGTNGVYAITSALLAVSDIVTSGFSDSGVRAVGTPLVATDVTASANGWDGIEFVGDSGNDATLTRVVANGNSHYGVDIQGLDGAVKLDTVTTTGNTVGGIFGVADGGTFEGTELHATDAATDAGITIELVNNATGTLATASARLSQGYGIQLGVLFGAQLDVEGATADHNGNVGIWSIAGGGARLALANAVSTDNDSDGIAITGFSSAATLTSSRSQNNGGALCGCGGSGLYVAADASDITVTDTSLLDNQSTGGAGLYVDTIYNASVLSIIRTTITGNHATGVSAPDGQGGGVNVQGIVDAGTTMLIQDSTISQNTATVDAGGIYFDDIGGGADTGGVTILRTTIEGNTTPGDGGGILVRSMDYSTTGDAVVALDQSTVSGNVAGGDGGGLYAHMDSGVGAAGIGILDIASSTFSGNGATDDGGAVFLDSSTADPGTFGVTFKHSTFAANTAINGVGGVFVLGTAIRLGLDHALIADNGTTDLSFDPNIEPSTFDWSLVENPGQGVTITGIGNIIGIDPQLATLAFNGGTTKTMLIAPGSPAYNAGNPAFAPPPATDQRGQARVYQVIDIGAVEWHPALALTGGGPRPEAPLIGMLFLFVGLALVAASRIRGSA